MNTDVLTKDTELTRTNREKLRRNKNLLYWYEQLYAHMLGPAAAAVGKKILEVGSGTSPLKLFYPQVITSDILDLEYLDIFVGIEAFREGVPNALIKRPIIDGLFGGEVAGEVVVFGHFLIFDSTRSMHKRRSSLL